MKELGDRRQVVRDYIDSLDQMAFWFQQQDDFMTDEIGVMFEASISRLQALESAMTIRIRQISEQKLADAMTTKIKSRERIDNVRRKIENTTSKRATKSSAQAKPSARHQKSGSRGSHAAKAKR